MNATAVQKVWNLGEDNKKSLKKKYKQSKSKQLGSEEEEEEGKYCTGWFTFSEPEV